MNILAIDIGTTTGWALGTRDGEIKSGSKSFAPSRTDGPGQRWLKFRAHLTELGRSVGELQAVYYEDVRRHGPGQVLAAHAYGGFLAHLQHWCEMNHVQCIPLGVGQIKKSWTGKGNAKKDAMIAEAIRRGYKPVDDNHADALAILDLARALESGQVELTSKPKKKKPAKPRKAPSFFAAAA
ncbi:MAG: hypothetical protein A3I66_01320 [Burkholderiales bacterium RIFCSPLOWO2_02_FULL_57_36]|nr:MAG: hypothetical protein A3I66_01320 [Burkholderiales bacterium RIFCSPLOWO2_02_FULL_57_36]